MFFHEREGVYDVLQNGLCLPGRFKGNMLLDTWHAFFDTMDRMKEKRAYHFEGRSWRLPGISEPLNPSIFIPEQKSCKSNSFILGIAKFRKLGFLCQEDAVIIRLCRQLEL